MGRAHCGVASGPVSRVPRGAGVAAVHATICHVELTCGASLVGTFADLGGSERPLAPRTFFYAGIWLVHLARDLRALVTIGTHPAGSARKVVVSAGAGANLEDLSVTHAVSAHLHHDGFWIFVTPAGLIVRVNG